MRVAIGGPAYNMQVSAMHCDTVAMICSRLTKDNHEIDVWHRHSSMLPENRDRMLRDAMTQADIFISIDSDTYLDDSEFANSLDYIAEWVKVDPIEHGETLLSFVSAPVRQGDGRWNFVDKKGENWRSLPGGILTDERVGWVGSAFTIHYCATYRIRPVREPYYLFGFAVQEQRWIGEDCYHSAKVKELGFGFVVDCRIKTGHKR